MSTFLDHLAENLRYARSRIAETVGPMVERVVRNWRENRERYQARAASGPSPLERRPGKIRLSGNSIARWALDMERRRLDADAIRRSDLQLSPPGPPA
jgi:hypothetical protein